AKYGDVVVAKFMNSVMSRGKKSAAEIIVYGSFEMIEKKTKKNPVEIFHNALDNVKPSIEVRSERSQALALRWLITAARARAERTMAQRLSVELMEAAENRGTAVKKRE